MNGNAKKREGGELGSLGTILVILRAAKGMTQVDLAARSGIKRASISEYECDVCTPDASTLKRLLDGLRLPWAALDLTRWFLARLEVQGKITEEVDDPMAPVTALASTLAERLREDVAVVRETTSTLRQLIAQLGQGHEKEGPGNVAVPERQSDREAALALCRPLRTLPRPDQLARIRAVPADGQWAICECLCLESQRACGEDALQAVSLCELALVAADLAGKGEQLRAKLRGFAGAHLGNALRVRGDLAEADRAFETAEAHWRVGEGAAEGLLEEGLFYALKSALRRAQRRFEEAKELLDRASALAVGAPFRLQVLMGKVRLLNEMGELEAAVDLLLEAKAVATPEDEPYALWLIWHNLADALSKLERFDEAAAYLPEARRHCLATQGELNWVRLMWIEGRIAAGRGAVEAGANLLARVRGEFASRQMLYDVALVSLELAVLYAREGRTEPVKSLARHLVPIFRTKGIHREALAALTLFREAAERERVTEALAQDLLLFLRKARHDPGLAFARREASEGEGESE